MANTLLNNKTIIDVVKMRFVWLALSAIFLIPGICALVYSTIHYPNHVPIPVGIDFTGGTIIQYSVDREVPTNEIGDLRTKLEKAGIESPVVQVLQTPSVDGGDIKNIISIKTQFSDEGQNEAIDSVASVIGSTFENSELVQVTSVGPILGKQLAVNSAAAVIIALLGIVAYLTLRFQLDYAIIALLALVHDVIFVLGVFSILGLVFGTHIDSMFITAILTVVGFSVHDTIVVFDRIRENLKFFSKKASFDEIVNASVNQTLARSINTSVTTLLTLLALYILGGATTKDFTLVMILGIAIGTYSSIFFASVLLALYHEVKDKKSEK